MSLARERRSFARVMPDPTDGVHRLVDMVVEEVSLVDRAANLRRFLIVKRDDSMDTEETKKTDVPDDSRWVWRSRRSRA